MQSCLMRSNTYHQSEDVAMMKYVQHSWMRHFLSLLIGVIVTPLSAAAHHETMLAHAIHEDEANLPVSRGRVHTGSTEQIYLMLKDGGSFSVPIPMTNRFKCELEGKKWVKTPIKGVDGRWKAFWCDAGMK